MDIKTLVKDNVATFEFYRDSNLWYSVPYTHNGNQRSFLFPVPIEDIGTALFKREDKAILFMRYIRKHLETINKR